LRNASVRIIGRLLSTDISRSKGFSFEAERSFIRAPAFRRFPPAALDMDRAETSPPPVKSTLDGGAGLPMRRKRRTPTRILDACATIYKV
jgi:hypothetical protein